MKRSIAILLAIMAVAGWATIAGATTITFNLPPGSTVSTDDSENLPVSAYAKFTTSANTLTVDLWNTLVNPKSVAQNISDLFFTLSSGQTSGTLISSSGLERTVASGETYTDGANVSTGWKLLNSFTLASVTGLKLDGLNTAADVPAHTIIGLPNVTYSNANGSIAGNGPHNPVLFGTAAAPVEFVIAISGLTAADTVSSATFSFGTTTGSNVPGDTPDQPVPLPPSVLLLGSGLLGLVGLRKFRKK